ncbi:alpha/beta fold hydrolase [Flavobacterium terrae]|uniref:Pimeloyl-ACP methyl ester carboxylesterase n=1 Tax=Flavobacterium terrae TaxID=415425 RepID=A0A1M6GI02_9FLAO|nr:alpha/beta hydrolase [Flavobacterium terrae]SHJ09584.1 Pimeloyl-ACP methyl ester carboxylesterase [Flavobacterium terrae]
MIKLLLKISLCFLFINCATIREKEYVFKSKNHKKAYIKSYNKSLKLWNVPYQEEDISTSFGKAHIIITGPNKGTPLVLLHGMDATSTMWFPNIEALSKKHRVYAIDFINEAGKSKPFEKSLSKDEIIKWYNEIFDHYKLERITLIGASKGGWIATLLAIQKDEKIEKIVLLSPAQTFKGIDQVGKSSSALFLKFFPSRKKLNKTLNAFSFYPKKINATYKEQLYLSYKHTKSNSSFLQLQPFSNEDLKKIAIPVLLLIGDNDVINSENSLKNAEENLSNCKAEIVKNAGHFLSIDQAEKVNDAIVNFIE